MKFISAAQRYFKDWHNLLSLGVLAGIGAWVYSRVWMVNPAILGDEYIYTMNARHAAPWDPSPLGDFSNYLFNLVYSSTNLCGEAFYTCGKLLNLVFFLGFILTLFIVAKRFMNYWIALGFMVLAGLSPVSVYVSMFLPESLYFFFIGLLLVALLRAADQFTWQNWAKVGVVLGLASLVKPHAWLAAIAIGIFLLVLSIGPERRGWKLLGKNIGGLLGGAILTRVVIGFAVAGPKALGFFGGYVGSGTVTTIFSGTSMPLGDNSSYVGAGPMEGVVALFWSQLNIHLLSVFALMGVVIVGSISGVIDLISTKTLRPVNSLALLAVIWLFSMIIAIVLFTGWITGGGDDHTTRVLLRYYDFLFVLVPLAGISVFVDKAIKINTWIRWGLAGAVVLFITSAYTGFFGTLTIQIADAPNLAGLVVNADVYNAAGGLMALALAVFAAFPRFTIYALALVLPYTMIGTGWQIQDQYQGFRAEMNSADKGGQYVRDNLDREDIDQLFVIATSRFDATDAALWADAPKAGMEYFGDGSQIPVEQIPEGFRYVLAIGNLGIAGEVVSTYTGDGFTLIELAPKS